MRVRAVLDTNVLISALVFTGRNPERAYALAVKRRFVLVFSPAIATELCRNLRAFQWNETRIQRVLRQAVKMAPRSGAMVNPPPFISILTGAAASDNRILECAVTGRADVIVSGDQDLLRLRAFQGIPIIRVADFVRFFPEDSFGIG